MAMPPERVTHAISFITGEVHALFLFAQALATSHPDPQALLSGLNEAAQQGLANIEAAPVPDAAVEGYQFVIGGIRKMAEAAAGRSQTRHAD